MQIEGLVIDENISMGDLKGTLEVFLKKVFGQDREIRLRPSFFPLQSLLLKSIFLVKFVREKAVMFVSKQA